MRARCGSAIKIPTSETKDHGHVKPGMRAVAIGLREGGLIVRRASKKVRLHHVVVEQKVLGELLRIVILGRERGVRRV